MENTWNGYWLKKGKHYSEGRFFAPLNENNIEFFAVFTPECLHTQASDHINKLYGFTDTNSKVHQNSARFGWRANKKNIEIFAYVYSRGERQFIFIDTVKAGIKNHYFIQAKENFYKFSLNNKTVFLDREKNSDHGFRHRLYPYYGGNNTAPHDMLILIFDKD